MDQNTRIKLNTFVELVYDGQVNRLAEELHVHRSTVYRWLDSSDVGMSYLGQLLDLGLDINWLVSQHTMDLKGMFADNDKGRELREKHFKKLK